MSFLAFTSTRLGSDVSCPRTPPRKDPEDPVRLEPRTPGLQVKHFATRDPHNFQSKEASNFKLTTQIDHIKEKCSVQES